MDQVTNVKVQFRLEQWIKLIAECQSSGMPVRKWCEQNGFREQTYYYYLKRIREKEIEKMPTSLIPVPDEKTTVFKKLEVQSPLPDTKAAVIIHLGSAISDWFKDYNVYQRKTGYEGLIEILDAFFF